MRGARLASYDLVRKVAAGGMAEIFLARQWGEGGFFRDVIIKRLYPHLAEHERQLRMFQDEARLLSHLSHPSIPQVYDVGFEDGYWYIAMEYVEGVTVADLWRLGAKAGQPMPLNVAIALIVQASDALHHAHERKDRAGRALRIVHRDVTPQNVMITRDGIAKLMDFGVAATSARKDTEAGAVRGTFAYMAPEQVRGRTLDKRADVFALGVVLYELTTGTRLFRGTDVQIMTQVVEQDAPPPSSRVPGYLADLEELVLAALARERGARVPSAAHLGAYLEELAMRHGLLVGPRTVARYFASVVPAEPILEEALGMVDVAPPRLELVPDSEARRVWGPSVDAPLPDIDEREVLDDLQMLSVPDEVREGDEQIDLLAAVEELDTFLDETAPNGEDAPYAEHDAPYPTVEDVAARGPLMLDDPADEGARDRPVVLLDERSRKDPSERIRRGGGEYVDALERRLAGETGEE